VHRLFTATLRPDAERLQHAKRLLRDDLGQRENDPLAAFEASVEQLTGTVNHPLLAPATVADVDGFDADLACGM
jgi:hypothetical protein